ncbi:MAG: lactate racemase domain-containing protein [Deltaproteobacteria bacterium]
MEFTEMLKMNFPLMARIRQNFDTSTITDISGEIRSQLSKLGLQGIVSPGQSVAITAGSRGISRLADILRALVNELKGIQAKPFIVPAMGSHGGATAEGQERLLAHYGVTEKGVGAPIKASMEVTQIGETAGGLPVLIDKFASQADHIVVVNRIKPHTDFEGIVESGLMKMLAIGLAKQKGADLYHNEFMRLGHYHVITSVARKIIEDCRIAFALAVVENQRDEIEILRIIPPKEIEETEKGLLLLAKELLPRIPFDPIDILIVNQMGKNLSGTGMDQNVIARSATPYHTVPSKPRIGRIIVRDLTQDSDGNALGIGNADFVTKRLVDSIDRGATYMNAMTSSCPELIRIPPHYDSDREVLEAAFRTLPESDPLGATIVHIENTLRLEEMYISEALIPEAKKIRNVSIVGTPEPMKFDPEGNLAVTIQCPAKH